MALTPPTLSASDTYITNNVDITFTADPSWEAVITGITVNGRNIPSDKYTVSSGNIEIDRDMFTLADQDYTVVIYATGYDNATVTVSILVQLWDNLTLYTTDDLLDLEPTLLDKDRANELTDAENRHDQTRDEIVNDMLVKLHLLQDKGEDYYGPAFDILDHLLNPISFRRASMYYALFLIFKGRSMIEDDTYDIKWKEYIGKYKKALNTACTRARWDIDIAERHTGSVRFVR